MIALFVAVIVLTAATSLLVIAATAGGKRQIAHVNELRKITPSHTFVRWDGSKGRWP